MAAPLTVLSIYSSPSHRAASSALVHSVLAKPPGGFTVTAAVAGENLAKRLPEDAFDVALLHVDSQADDALNVLDNLLDDTPTLPVVVLLGVGSEGLAAEALRRGAEDIVFEAFSLIDRLPRTLHSAYEWRRAARELDAHNPSRSLRKGGERARDTQATLHERILGTTAEGILAIDRDGTILFANTAATRLTGWSVDEILGSDWYDRIDGQHTKDTSRPANDHAIQRAINQGLASKGESTFSCHDGSSVAMAYSCQPIREGGETEGAVLSFYPLTEMQGWSAQHQTLLASTHQRIRELTCLHTAFEALHELNSLETIMQRIVGALSLIVSPPLRGQGRILLDGVEYTSPSLEAAQGTLSTPIVIDSERRGVVEISYVDERPEREERPSLTSTQRLLNLITHTLSGAIARHEAETDREQLAVAIEQSDDGVVLTDSSATILYVNPAFTRITGYSREEAIGQNPRILKSDEHDDIFYRELWDTLTQGKTWRGHFTNRRKDGSFYEENATISPVFDRSGDVHRYVAVKRDVTHERQLEKQLQVAQRLEAIGQLAGGVAHDFNNILQAMMADVEFLRDERSSKEDREADLMSIHEGITRASDLTHHLLAFSRRQVLDRRVVDPNEIVFGLLKMIRRIIGEHITLKFLPGEDVERVFADPGQIEQVIVNLCVNARDAMTHGGDLLIQTSTLTVDEPFVSTHPWARPGRYTSIRVSDSGVGMDAATQAQIFDPFFTTKPEGKGTGLGLATTYGIVKQHEGLILVDSALGEGTTFEIYLPVTDRTEEDRAEEPVATQQRGTETILVAEDDTMVRRSVQRILERAGYTVLLAEDGAAAIRLYEEHADQIDLTLLDVVMPKRSGREVYDRIRSWTPRANILFSSGYSDNAIHTDFVLDPDLHLLRKPYSPDDLLRRVRQRLEAER